ncbi:hypothetical protein CFP65_5170 [Kitasatospora sp. MMS16-BH015]|nr:hypothetical protein CFP65_5170 [Kitasatospora sp. MMS16-BH015]
MTGRPATTAEKETTPGAAARTGVPGAAARSTPRCPAAQRAGGASNLRSTPAGPPTGQARPPPALDPRATARVRASARAGEGGPVGTSGPAVVRAWVLPSLEPRTGTGVGGGSASGRPRATAPASDPARARAPASAPVRAPAPASVPAPTRAPARTPAPTPGAGQAARANGCGRPSSTAISNTRRSTFQRRSGAGGRASAPGGASAPRRALMPRERRRGVVGGAVVEGTVAGERVVAAVMAGSVLHRPPLGQGVAESCG